MYISNPAWGCRPDQANPDRGAQRRGQGAAWFRPKYECWIAVPTCPFTFDLFDNGPYHFSTAHCQGNRPDCTILHAILLKMYTWRHGAYGKYRSCYLVCLTMLYFSQGIKLSSKLSMNGRAIFEERQIFTWTWNSIKQLLWHSSMFDLWR